PTGRPGGCCWRSEPGAYVQELADPCLAGQLPDRADQERPVGAGVVPDAGVELADLVADLLVNRVVVLAAQPVIPDPGRVRYRRVDLALRAGHGGAVGPLVGALD